MDAHGDAFLCKSILLPRLHFLSCFFAYCAPPDFHVKCLSNGPWSCLTTCTTARRWFGNNALTAKLCGLYHASSQWHGAALRDWSSMDSTGARCLSLPSANWFQASVLDYSRADHNVVGLCCNDRVWLLKLSPRSTQHAQLVGVLCRVAAPGKRGSGGASSKSKAVAIQFAPREWIVNTCTVMYADGVVCTWDLETKTIFASSTHDVEDCSANSMAFTLVPRLSASGPAMVVGVGKRLFFRDFDGVLLGEVPLDAAVTCLSSAPKTPSLIAAGVVAVGDETGSVYIFDCISHRLLAQGRQQAAPIRFLNWNCYDNGKLRLLSTAFDRDNAASRVLWLNIGATVATPGSTQEAERAVATLQFVHLSPNRKHVASKTGDRSTKSADSRGTGKKNRNWACTAWVSSQVLLHHSSGRILPDGGVIATALETGQILLSSLSDSLSLNRLRKGQCAGVEGTATAFSQTECDGVLTREFTTDNKHTRTVFGLIPLLLYDSDEDEEDALDATDSDSDSDSTNSSESNHDEPVSHQSRKPVRVNCSSACCDLRSRSTAKSYMLSVSMDRQIILWRSDGCTRLQFVWSLPTLGGFPYALYQNPFRISRVRQFVAGCGDKTIRSFSLQRQDTKSGDGHDESRTNATGAIFGRDSASPPALFWRGIPGRVTSVAWHPIVDGTVAFGVEAGEVHRLELNKPHIFKEQRRTGKRMSNARRYLARHTGSVLKLEWRLAFSDDSTESPDEAEIIALLYSLSAESGELFEIDLRHAGVQPVAFHRRLPGLPRRNSGIKYFSWHADNRHLAISAGGGVRIFHCGRHRGDAVHAIACVPVAAEPTAQSMLNFTDGVLAIRRQSSSSRGSGTRLCPQIVLWNDDSSGTVVVDGIIRTMAPQQSPTALRLVCVAQQALLGVISVRTTPLPPTERDSACVTGFQARMQPAPVTTMRWSRAPEQAASETSSLLLATGDTQGFTQVWRVAVTLATVGRDTMELLPLYSLRGHNAPMLCVRWVNNHALVTSSCDHAILLWHMDDQCYQHAPVSTSTNESAGMAT